MAKRNEFFEREPITYKEEGFDDFLIRQFNWARDEDTRGTLLGEPTQVVVPGGAIEYPEFEIPPSNPYGETFQRGQGVMTIGGTISTGTDMALPNLDVSKNCTAYEIYAQVKTLTSGSVTFTVNVGGLSIGSITVTAADLIHVQGINATLLGGSGVTVDVSGTFDAEDATIGIKVKQDSEIKT